LQVKALPNLREGLFQVLVGLCPLPNFMIGKRKVIVYDQGMLYPLEIRRGFNQLLGARLLSPLYV
jgi:hypothetical protein